jgi:hypothetical protein
MVCGDHKGLPKAQIKKYRAQRRAEREKGEFEEVGRDQAVSKRFKAS